MKTLLARLEKCGTFTKARDWLKTQSSLDGAWQECKRGDWMLQYLKYVSDWDIKKLVKIACDCVRRSLSHIPERETSPQQAIELVEKWVDGEQVSIKDLEVVGEAVQEAGATRAVVGLAGVLAVISAAQVAQSTRLPEGAKLDWIITVISRVSTERESSDIIRKYFPTLPKTK